ncbi:hypothetical protein BX18_18135 [Escherichia coli O111:NM str. 2009C-4006]|nr:hypothetical protein BX51_25520 [Escherichia coli O145:NM str. 2010C-3526]EYV21212.1 hypothetical protein BX49_25190 [Escherichia coli O145:NM str. 2010C-3518]EYV23492.1 hypothetical protein BX48_06160 [Escherichia coli O145:NM str. 2010C-3517]EYV23619.1 hypothetical protein BX47_02310 [Escherichia coli O145:NM str. 2010C-3516]EYV36508.1 hypothetical protein BX45_23660 [Escherichia coli O145:NM str. 2010C-3510]EYV39140.1 hypothetical protein BX46_25885 [Escherichia coli O145:NM str. 2010C-3
MVPKSDGEAGTACSCSAVFTFSSAVFRISVLSALLSADDSLTSPKATCVRRATSAKRSVSVLSFHAGSFWSFPSMDTATEKRSGSDSCHVFSTGTAFIASRTGDKSSPPLPSACCVDC